MNEFARPNLAVDQLPPANSADKDKVLTIDANGVPVWAENSGGGSGGGGVLVVHVDWDVGGGTLDKTWQEIYDSPFSVVVDSGEFAMYFWPVYVVEINNSEAYDVIVVDYLGSPQSLTFRANNVDGYPVIFNGD